MVSAAAATALFLEEGVRITGLNTLLPGPAHEVAPHVVAVLVPVELAQHFSRSEIARDSLK